MVRPHAFTAIIPVRAGSKGIPGKNTWEYEGVSLLARAIRLGFAVAPAVARVVVSTDSAEMQSIAREEGAESEHLRPAQLATDTATSVDVVRHAIDAYRITSEHLLLLQVTSPLRTQQDCRAFLESYLTSGANAAVSVVKLDEPRPEKLKRIQDNLLFPYLGKTYEGPRQSLPQPYALNGAFYAISRQVFLQESSFLPQRTFAHVMPAERSHNLDSLEDLEILKAMLETKRWSLEQLQRKTP